MPAVDASMSTKSPGNHAETTSTVCLGDPGRRSAAEYPFVSKPEFYFKKKRAKVRYISVSYIYFLE